jgi:hypothetical protein
MYTKFIDMLLRPDDDNAAGSKAIEVARKRYHLYYIEERDRWRPYAERAAAAMAALLAYMAFRVASEISYTDIRHQRDSQHVPKSKSQYSPQIRGD